MNLKELMEKRTKAWDEAKAFAETKKDEKVLMSDEDFKTYEEKNEQSRLKELEEFLDNQELEIERYDEDLVRKLIKKIIVYDEMFKVIFKSGLEVEINQ